MDVDTISLLQLQHSAGSSGATVAPVAHRSPLENMHKIKPCYGLGHHNIDLKKIRKHTHVLKWHRWGFFVTVSFAFFLYYDKFCFSLPLLGPSLLQHCEGFLLQVSIRLRDV